MTFKSSQNLIQVCVGDTWMILPHIPMSNDVIGIRQSLMWSSFETNKPTMVAS